MYSLFKQGNYSESIHCLETALQIDSTTPNAKQYLEKVLLIQQDQRNVCSSDISHANSRHREKGEQLRQSHSREENSKPSHSRSSRKRSHSVDDNHHHHHHRHHHHHH